MMNEAEKRAKQEEAEAAKRANERARARHRRRIRNQAIAYITVALMICVAAVFAYKGSISLIDVIAEKREAMKVAKEAEAAEAELNAANEAEEGELSDADIEMIEQINAESSAIIEELPKDDGQSGQGSDDLYVMNDKAALLDEYVDTVMAEMPLKDKVAGLFISTPEQITNVDAAIKAGDGTRDALAELAIGGLVYSGKNIKNNEQIFEMLMKTSEMSKYAIMLAISEAGGASELSEALGLETIDAPSMLAESGDVDAAYSAGESIAKRLLNLGFTTDMPLSINLTSDYMSEAERNLSYGSDPTTASELVASEVKGITENGIKVAVGTFPTVAGDPEGSNIPSTSATLEELRNSDFRMFKSAIDAGCSMVVVGNIAAPAIVGDNTPCSMSSKIVTDELRNELAFEGVIVTEAMDTPTVTDYFTSEQAAVAAIQAGADMIYRPENLEDAINGVLDAVNSGSISEDRINESLRRILRVKYEDRVNASTN